MSPLGITSDRKGREAVVHLSGKLDISQIGPVELALAAVEQDQPPLLIVDLSGLTFMDSSGLRVILEADRRARLQARRLAVIPGPEQVHRVFLITLLDRRLTLIQDGDQDGDMREKR